MKTIKQLILSTILILTIFSCKKDKLTGDNKILIGTWTTIPYSCGCCTAPGGTPTDPKYKLELIEKGKYKLYKDGKKIEDGRLLIVDGFLTFKCGEMKSHFDGKKIDKFNADTLKLDRSCEKEYILTFVKK